MCKHTLGEPRALYPLAAASLRHHGFLLVGLMLLLRLWRRLGLKTVGILRCRGNAFGVFRRQPHIRIDKEPKVRTIIRDFKMVFKSFLKLFNGFEISVGTSPAEISNKANDIYQLEHFS